MPAAHKSPVAGLLESFGLNRKELFSWALYDVANSAFACTIMVAVLPVYFADVVAKDLSSSKATAIWAYLAALATLLSAFISPILGIFADQKSHKKKYLAIFTGIGAISSASLFFASSGDVMLTSILFLIASISFAAGEVFYESLLPHIANGHEVHRTSTSAYALGYFGGGLLLALNLLWITQPHLFGIPDAGVGVRLSFLSVGFWWIGFSLPLFRNVREPSRSPQLKEIPLKFTKQMAFAAKELKATLSHIRSYRNAFLFLLAFWFYSDGVGTIMKLAVIYGKEVGISNNDLIAAILMVQFVGVPFTFAFGPISQKFGVKNTLYLNLVVYFIASCLSYFMSEAWHFWLLAFIVAAVQGATQALSRSIYSQLIPKARSSEFFSFYSVSSKFAGMFGPLIFGLMSDLTGGSRLSIVLIASLFIIGMIFLSKVDLEEGRKEATS